VLKEIEAGAALENCRRLINQINAWLSAEERRQSFFFIECADSAWKSPHHAPPFITVPRLRALCSSSQAAGLAMLCTWLCIGTACAGVFAGGLVLLAARLP
jgi:hypothetical protein